MFHNFFIFHESISHTLHPSLPPIPATHPRHTRHHLWHPSSRCNEHIGYLTDEHVLIQYPYRHHPQTGRPVDRCLQSRLFPSNLTIFIFSHITPVLSDLHWLLVRHRISFKIATITFKVLQFQHPFCLATHIPQHVITRILRSSSSSSICILARKPQWQSPNHSYQKQELICSKTRGGQQCIFD